MCLKQNKLITKQKFSQSLMQMKKIKHAPVLKLEDSDLYVQRKMIRQVK